MFFNFKADTDGCDVACMRYASSTNMVCVQCKCLSFVGFDNLQPLTALSYNFDNIVVVRIHPADASVVPCPIPKIGTFSSVLEVLEDGP